MKIISFSSYTATWSYIIAEATIASVMQKKVNDVLFITPGDLFKGISNFKQEKIIRKEFSLNGYELGTVLTKKEFKEINSIMRGLNKKNFNKLVIDNVQIGKMALYEFLLNHKKTNLDITQDEWKECCIYLKNTLISFFACRIIINKEKPDRVLVYNALYSVNHVWESYAKAKGIPVYFLHNGLNYSDSDKTLIIAKNNSLYFFEKLKNIWSKVKNIPVSQEMLCYVTDHFLALLKAKHPLIYSKPKSKASINIRKIFGIRENQKILTATMSSYDERFAAEYIGVRDIPEHLLFSSQVEWIRSMINFVKNKQDVFLIIRVHPREFPNKRESVKSEHVKLLKKIFNNLPNNVKINWPTDNVSIYDLALETDVFLNAWSSVGVEMSLLGIPVVIYSKELILYPDDLNYVAKDRSDYFVKIESALKDGWNYEKIKKTYRWLTLYYYRTVIWYRGKNGKIKQSKITNLCLSVMNYFYNLLSPRLRAFLIKIYYMIPGLGIGRGQVNDCKRQLTEHVDISSVDKMIRKSEDTFVNIEEIIASKITEKEENDFVRHEIKRIYKALYGNLSVGMNIKENSLQYNLYKVFHKL